MPCTASAAGLDPYNAETALDCATDIVSFTGSFHGRTMGALALTYKVRAGWAVLGKGACDDVGVSLGLVELFGR